MTSASAKSPARLVRLAPVAVMLGVTVAFGCSSEERVVTQTVTESVETTTQASEARPGSSVRVAAVIDGDTIELANGKRVRLLQIDAPEPEEGECYSRKATRVLRSLLPEGTGVRLQADAKLDKRDRFGRFLRYIFKGKTNVNVALVRRGAASPYFFGGTRGRYAKRLLREARLAQTDARGLWQACRGTELDPLQPLLAISRLAPPPAPPSAPPPPPPEPPPPALANCDPSYPDFCIPPPPPDLDCADIGISFTVIGSDPHGFDGEGDGIGCESY